MISSTPDMTVTSDGEIYVGPNQTSRIDYSSLFDDVKKALGISTVIKMSVPLIEKVKFNGPATIVFWSDGTKTVVKKTEKDRDDKRVAILYAIGKKMFGTNSKLKKTLDSYIPDDAEEMMAVLEEKEPKKKRGGKPKK